MQQQLGQRLVRRMQYIGNTYKIASAATINVAALSARVETAEENINVLQNIISNDSTTGTQLREAITELQGIVKTGNDANTILRADLTALQKVVDHETAGLAAIKASADDAKVKAENAQIRVAAIEADYLKAADDFILNCGYATGTVQTVAV